MSGKDIAAYIVAAVMILGPLAAGAMTTRNASQLQRTGAIAAPQVPVGG